MKIRFPFTARALPKAPFAFAGLVLLFLLVTPTLAQQQESWSATAAPKTSDSSAQDPGVMRTQLERLVDQTQVLSLVAALPTDTRHQLEAFRSAIRNLDPKAMGVLANDAGPEVARLNRILLRVNRELLAPPAIEKSGGFPVAIYPDTPVPEVDLSGEPPDVSGCDPEEDDYGDCVATAFGLNRPDNLGAQICKVEERKTPSTLFGLKFGVIAAETVAVILNRVCNQDVLGFNAAPVCIPSDLVFLALRTAEDFILLCEDLLTASEILGSYDRLAHLHGDVEAAQSSIAATAADLNNHDGRLSSHNGNLSLHSSRLRNHDNRLSDHDDRLDAHDDTLTLHDEEVEALLAGAQGTITESQRVLIQALRLLITPQGQRDIDPTLLTCQGDDCPVVLPCKKGSLGWPCK